MEFILIFIFNNTKKEENFLKFIQEEKKNNDMFNKYDKYLFDYFKKEIIDENLYEDSIKEFNEIINNDKEEEENFLLFIFNIENQVEKQDLEQYLSFVDLDKNFYNLLNYKNNDDVEFKKNLYKINNNNFDRNKLYNFIITTENKNINNFKEILKKDKIYEKIYFNTNFNNPLNIIIKESKTILYNS